MILITRASTQVPRTLEQFLLYEQKPKKGWVYIGGAGAAVQLNTLQTYISRNLTSHLNQEKKPGSPKPKLDVEIRNHNPKPYIGKYA